MSDEFFLRYANNIFKDDPKNFKLVIQDFIDNQWNINEAYTSYRKLRQVQLEVMVENIGIFSNCKDFNSALKIKDEIVSKALQEFNYRKNPHLDTNDFDVAFEAVFYQDHGFCDGTWYEDAPCNGYRKIRHNFGIGENFRIKCHECCQLFFRSMLMDFVSNMGFKQRVIKKGETFLIDENWFDENFPGQGEIIILDSDNRSSFDYYLVRAYDCVETKADVINSKLVKYEYFTMTNLFDKKRSIYPIGTRFNDFLTSIVSYSLVEFLRKNNLKKLKICPFCNNFFIAKDIKRKTRCYSKECDKEYQRQKKKKQRGDDPVTYY